MLCSEERETDPKKNSEAETTSTLSARGAGDDFGSSITASEQTLRVISKKTLAPDITEIYLAADTPLNACPGQFAHFEIRGTLLRRPISIAGFDGESGTLRIIVQNVGRGSAALSSLSNGDEIRALLPLGRPFPMDRVLDTLSRGGTAWLVSGGIGIAPVLFCADIIKKSGGSVKSFAGFRDREHVFCTDELKEFGAVSVSAGGFVTDDLKGALETEKPDIILACGPSPMLAALQKICGAHKITAYVSLEEHMGCGIGACLVCSCKINRADGFSYKRVCSDGPVFELSEVLFE